MLREYQEIEMATMEYDLFFHSLSNLKPSLVLFLQISAQEHGMLKVCVSFLTCIWTTVVNATKSTVFNPVLVN